MFSSTKSPPGNAEAPLLPHRHRGKDECLLKTIAEVYTCYKLPSQLASCYATSFVAERRRLLVRKNYVMRTLR